MTWQDKLKIGLGYRSEDLAFDPNLIEWIEAVASPQSTLLAHADDGVIWGYMHEGKLLSSHQANDRISPALRLETLQELHVFDEDSEIRLWRDLGGWQAVRLIDAEDEEACTFDEAHILWGTKATKAKQGFTLLEDGVQGLKHLPPSQFFERDGIILGDRLYLKVRHYLRPNAIGVSRITMSRLVSLGQLNHGK